MSDLDNGTSSDGIQARSESLVRAAAAKVSEGTEAVKERASEGAEALRDAVGDMSERAGQAYTRGNVAVTRSVDPIPSLALVAAVGFLTGYVCAASRR